MITSKMRLLFTIMTLTLLTESFGQISGYDFTGEDLKGYERITTTRINFNERDSAVYNGIYFINEFGDIVRSEHYEKEELTHWAKYEYFENGFLNSIPVHILCDELDLPQPLLLLFTLDSFF